MAILIHSWRGILRLWWLYTVFIFLLYFIYILDLFICLFFFIKLFVLIQIRNRIAFIIIFFIYIHEFHIFLFSLKNVIWHRRRLYSHRNHFLERHFRFLLFLLNSLFSDNWLSSWLFRLIMLWLNILRMKLTLALILILTWVLILWFTLNCIFLFDRDLRFL